MEYKQEADPNIIVVGDQITGDHLENCDWLRRRNNHETPAYHDTTIMDTPLT
jgi:hypothetical protein